MGKRQKVTAADILEILEKEEQITLAELAKEFNCSKETIKNRIRELREDDEAIIHNENGLMLITKDSLGDKEIADALDTFIKWIGKVFRGIMLCAKPTRPLLPTLSRSLKDSMSLDERRELSKACVRIKALLDYVETEEEDAI